MLLQQSNSIYSLALITIAILAVLAMPFSVDTVPPLLDYPIHLARAYIVMEYDDSPILPKMFNINWRPLPNLASDLTLYWLGKIMTIEEAGRLLACLCVVATFLGVIFLHRINFGEWGWWPLLAALPAFHGAFTAGFINYSIGIALIPYALIFSIIAGRKSLVLRVFIDSASALILFFCHVISTGIFGVFLMGLTFEVLINNKRLSIGHINFKSILACLIPFVVPAFLYFQFSLSEVISRDSYMAFGEWKILPKLRGVMMPFLSGHYILDLIVLLFVYSLFMLFFYRGNLKIKKEFLFGILATLFAFIVLPGHLLDAAFIMDRLPIAAVLITIATTNPLSVKRRSIIFIIMLLISLVTARSYKTMADWNESDQYLLRLTLATENIEPGSSVLIVSPLTEISNKSLRQWHQIRFHEPDWHFALGNIPTLHSLPAMPLIRRSAFSQIHFVWSDKQVLSLAQDFQHLDYGDGGASTWSPEEIFPESGGSTLDLAPITNYFDYLLIVYVNHLENGIIDKIKKLSPVYEDEAIILLKSDSDKSWRARHGS